MASARQWIAGAGIVMLCLSLWTPAADARRAEVITQDGKVRVGEVVQDNAQSIVLDIHGIKITINRGEVREVRYLPTIEEEYQRRRAALKDQDLEGRYKLAYWLYDNNDYAAEQRLPVAKRELDALVQQFPAEARVRQLRRIVEARLKLIEQDQGTAPDDRDEAGRPRQPDRADPDQPGDQSPRDARLGRDALPTEKLDRDQINLIRVYELPSNLAEAEPRINVPRDVIDTLIQEYAHTSIIPRGRTARRQLLAAQGWEQMDLMFRLSRLEPGVRELYAKVDVVDDPPAMRQFRTVHQRLVLNYCATNSCHGGANDAGKALFLYRDRGNSLETVYTNFYILTHAGASVAGRFYDMIDREQPEMSLLVQYALPQDQARARHPEVANWRSAFTGLDDRRLTDVIDWIRMLYKPKPNYQINMQIPKLDVPDDETAQGDAQGDAVQPDQAQDADDNAADNANDDAEK